MTDAATFKDTLKNLTDAQLARLEEALRGLQSMHGDVDKLIEHLRGEPSCALNADAQRKVGARTWELSLTNPDAEYSGLHAQALEEFLAGKLADPKPPKPRRRRPRRTSPAAAPNPKGLGAR